MSEPWKCGHTQPMIMCNVCVANLEAERDRLKEELHRFQTVAGGEIDRLKSEIDRYKAEAEELTYEFGDNLKKDRDAWKAKAEGGK